MMFDATYKAIKRKIISVGILPTIKLIINHIITTIFYRDSLLFYIDIASYSLNPQKIGQHIIGKEIKCLTDLSSKDTASIRDYAGEKYIKESKRRFANNWRLFLAYIDNRVAGACWAVTNNSEFKTKVVPLLDGNIVLIDGWTIPSFRGKNVYPFLLSHIAVQFKEKNFKRAFISSNVKNFASIKGINKAGYLHFINYEVYNLFRYEIVIWKPASRK